MVSVLETLIYPPHLAIGSEVYMLRSLIDPTFELKL